MYWKRRDALRGHDGREVDTKAAICFPHGREVLERMYSVIEGGTLCLI